jgi:hypothetical protein
MIRTVRTLALLAVATSLLVGWSATAIAGAQSACADLGGTVGPDQICQVHSATDTYKIDFSCRGRGIGREPISSWPEAKRTDRERRTWAPKAWYFGWARTRSPTRSPGTRRSTMT